MMIGTEKTPESSITILQISDLENGTIFKRQIGTANEEWTAERRWESAIQLIFEGLDKSHVSTIDLLVLNGDLIKCSKEETFDGVNLKFREISQHFVKPLSSRLYKNFKTKNIVIVPGNQDVFRNECNSPVTGDAQTTRLIPFFQMIADLQKSLHGTMEIFSAPSCDSESIISLHLSQGAFQIFPLNSVLLSGASIEVITAVFSGRKGTQLKDYEKEHIYATTKAVNDSIKKLSTVDNILKDRLSSDAAYIPQEHLKNLANIDHLNVDTSPPCKIAIVHHNSIPYPHETSDRVKSYNFCNSGAFHNTLFNGGFRYVLHGHQHEEKVYELADLSDKNKGSTEPRRALFIGASCFGSEEAHTERIGFNVIKISRPNADTCEAQIEHINFPATRTHGVEPGGLEISTKNHTQFATQANPEKLRIAEKIYRHCLHTENIEDHKRFLQEDDIETDAFYGEFRNAMDAFHTTNAIYSVSVFPPTLWGERRFAEFFLPQARRNLARAASIAKSLEAEITCSRIIHNNTKKRFHELIHSSSPALHFRFSKTVFSAIELANSNARHCKIASRFIPQDSPVASATEESLRSILGKRTTREINFFLRALHSRRNTASEQPKNSYDSVSIWDNATCIDGLELDNPKLPNIPKKAMREVVARLMSRPIHQGLSLSFSKIDFEPADGHIRTHRDKFQQLQEYPRIAIWEKEHFFQPQALECIEFHEQCGFPLFWINPKRLTGRTSGSLRSLIGHYSIYGSTPSGTISERHGYNNDSGKSRTALELKSGDERLSDMEAIWGIHEVPDANMEHHIDEFSYLANRADIMFAADAWAISRLGDAAWKEMEESLMTLARRQAGI